MLRMIVKPGRALGTALALGTLAMGAAAAAPAEAQQVAPRVRVERDDCRCVDADGNPIEKCTCFTFPDVDRIVTGALGRVQGRARLGITLASDADQQGVGGALVESVMDDGPADEAGIRKGDVITRINGTSLLSPMGPEVERELDEDQSLPTQRLLALVRQIDPGDTVEVDFLRDGAPRSATLEAEDLDRWTYSIRSGEGGPEVLRGRLLDLGGRMGNLHLRTPREGARGWTLEAPHREGIRIWTDADSSPRIFMPRSGDGARTFMFRGGEEDGVLRECPTSGSGDRGMVFFSSGCVGGLELVSLNPGLSEYFGTGQGVLVADVHEDSRLGLRPGDVVLAVGSREATDPERLQRILESYGADEEVSLRVMRQKREMQVQGTLGR